MDSDSGHQVVLGLHLPNLLVPRLRKPASVLLGKRFISGRSSVEGGPGCKQRLLYEVTVSGLKAIQADFFQAATNWVSAVPSSNLCSLTCLLESGLACRRRAFAK